MLGAATDGSMWVWNPAGSMSQTAAIPSVTQAITDIDIDREHGLVAVADSGVGFWSYDDPLTEVHPRIDVEGDDNFVLSVAVDPSRSQVLVGPRSGALARYDYGATTPSDTMELDSPIFRLAVSPDDADAAVSLANGTAVIVDLQTWTQVATLDAQDNLTYVAEWSAAGDRLATAGRDGIIRIWDSSNWSMISEMDKLTSSIKDLTWSPDASRIFAAGEDGTVHAYDPATGAVVHRLRGPGTRVSSVAVSPDGSKLAAGEADGRLWLWDAKTLELLAGPLSRNTSAVYGLAWVDDTTLIAADQRAVIWQMDPSVWHQQVCEQLQTAPIDDLWSDVAADIDRIDVCPS